MLHSLSNKCILNNATNRNVIIKIKGLDYLNLRAFYFVVIKDYLWTSLNINNKIFAEVLNFNEILILNTSLT